MFDSSSFSLIIRPYLELLKSFESSVIIFNVEIAYFIKAFDIKLEKITGMSTTLTAVIFSEMGGDIVPKFFAYAGLYSISRQSDEAKSEGRMSKRNSLLASGRLACRRFQRSCCQHFLSKETLGRKRPLDCHKACLS